MSFLTDWITNIIIFILLATVMDMLLPSSAMQKYAKMVLGLLLISILISPVFKIISIDFEDLLASATSMDFVEKGKMENLIDHKKKEIQATQDAYILEEMAVQLKKDGEEELIKQFNYKIKHLEVSLKTFENPEIPKDLEKISVVLTPVQEDHSSIEVVQKVEINTKGSLPGKKDETVDITKFLAMQWGVDQKTIDIGFERRGTTR